MSTVKRISDSYSIIGTGANTVVTIGNVSTSPANLTVDGNITVGGILSNNYYYSNGSPFSGSGVGLAALINDPAPTLGGNLNTGAYSITSSSGAVDLTGNLLVGGILTDNYYYANGTPFSSGGSSASSNSISQLSSSLSITDTGSNGQLTLNIDGNVYLSSTKNSFSIGGQTAIGSFALIEVSGGPFTLGYHIPAIIMSPSTNYCLVANDNTVATDLYYINTSSGVPVLVTPGVISIEISSVATYSPDGQYVYVMNNQPASSTYTLNEYKQDSSTGALTLIGSINVSSVGAGFKDIKISPDGLFAYISYAGTSGIFPTYIYVYSRNNATGVLGGLAQTFTTLPNGLVLHLSVSQYGVYATVQGTTTLYEFTRDASTGNIALSNTHTLAHAAYSFTGAGTISPDGAFYYYSETTTGNIIGYSISPSTGSLTILPGSPYISGLGSSGAPLTISPDGTKVYTAPVSGSTTVYSFTRDLVSGNVTSTGVSHSTGTGTSSVPVAVTKDNLHIITALQYLGQLDVLQTASSVANPLLSATYGTGGEGGTLQVSGAVTISGPLVAASILGNSITSTETITAPTFTSTVATGTAPFSVTSTTPVTNLTVDNINVATSTASYGYFPALSSYSSGVSTFVTSTTLTYNPALHTLTAPIFSGNLTGYVNGILLSGTNATTMHFPASTANIAATNIGQTFTKTQTYEVQPLTVTANVIVIDMSLGNNFAVSLQANTAQTLNNPTNAVAGTSGQIAITQNASPSTLTFGANWVYTTSGTNPSVSTTANAINLITYYVVNSNSIWFTLLTHGVA